MTTTTKRSASVRPQEWPTSKQESELWCVRHHTGTPACPPNMVLHAWTPTTDAVSLAVPDPVEHSEAVAFLKANGFVVLHDDGTNVMYA